MLSFVWSWWWHLMLWKWAGLHWSRSLSQTEWVPTHNWWVSHYNHVTPVEMIEAYPKFLLWQYWFSPLMIIPQACKILWLCHFSPILLSSTHVAVCSCRHWAYSCAKCIQFISCDVLLQVAAPALLALLIGWLFFIVYFGKYHYEYAKHMKHDPKS